MKINMKKLPTEDPDEQNQSKTKEKVVSNKFPWNKVLVIDLILLINQVSVRMVYPFIPFMVKEFFPELNDTQLGYKSGILGSAFNIGIFFGGLLWGYMADMYGRRAILLTGIVGTFITTNIFGMALNYIWALIGRFLWGLLNGNIGVGKTYLSEILTNEQQSQGFATIGVMDATGRIIGPILGGFLGDKNNIIAFSNKFKFHFWLPCLLCSLFSIVGFIVAYKHIKETITADTKKRLLSRSNSKNQTGLLSIIKTREIFLTAVMLSIFFNLFLLLAILSIHGNGMDQIIPLYLLNPIDHGGFGFKSSDIGIMYSFAGPFQLLSALFFYPQWIKWFGYRKGEMLSTIIVSLITYFLPLLSTLNNYPKSVTMWFICPYIGIFQAFRVMCFTSMNVLINNSCYPEQRSKANGMSMTLSGIGSFLGPIFGGYIMAWSENNTLGRNFNFRFPFTLFCLFHIIVCMGAYSLPSSIEMKKEHIDRFSSELINSSHSIQNQPNKFEDVEENTKLIIKK